MGIKRLRLFNSIFIIYIFSVLNFLLSVSLQLFLAFLFGAKIEMDAYLVAIVIPMVINNLILSSELVFVPVFKHYKIKNAADKEGFRAFASTIFNLLALSLAAITVLGVLFAPKLVSLFSPGFSAQAKELTQMLFRIMMPSVIFSGLAAFLISVYHSEEKFILPALALVMNMSILIISTVLLNSSIGIRSLAAGVLLGSIAQFLILLLPVLYKRQYSFCLDLGLSELPDVGRKFLYLGTGGIFLGFILMIEKFLASKLPEGSISALGYANKVTSLIALLPSTAIPTVLLPQLSKYYALEKLDNLRTLLSGGIRMSFLCLLPIVGLLLFFRETIIRMLFERGAFDTIAVNNTSLALICYLGLLITIGVSKIVSVGFFAIHDLFTPFLLMLVTLLLYVLVAPFLTHVFSFKGLAMSLSLVSLVAMLAQIFILRRKLSGIGGRQILRSASKIIVASLIMGVVSFHFFKKLPYFFVISQNLTLLVRMGISVLIGFLAFNIASIILRIEELASVYKVISLRLVMFMRNSAA